MRLLNLLCFFPPQILENNALACCIRLFQARLTFEIAASMMNPDVYGIYWGKIPQPETLEEKEEKKSEDIVSSCRSLGISCDKKDEIDELVDENNQLEVKAIDEK